MLRFTTKKPQGGNDFIQDQDIFTIAFFCQQVAAIETFYSESGGKTVGEVADFWGRFDPYHGVQQQDRNKIRAATIATSNGAARPTFQTMCCFAYDASVVDKVRLLSRVIMPLVDKTFDLRHIEGFDDYFRRIVSR